MGLGWSFIILLCDCFRVKNICHVIIILKSISHFAAQLCSLFISVCRMAWSLISRCFYLPVYKAVINKQVHRRLDVCGNVDIEEKKQWPKHCSLWDTRQDITRLWHLPQVPDSAGVHCTSRRSKKLLSFLKVHRTWEVNLGWGWETLSNAMLKSRSTNSVVCCWHWKCRVFYSADQLRFKR